MHSAKRLVNMSTHARRHQSASARVGMFASRCPFSQLSKNQVLLYLERSDWFCIIPCGRRCRACGTFPSSYRSSAHLPATTASSDYSLHFRVCEVSQVPVRTFDTRPPALPRPLHTSYVVRRRTILASSNRRDWPADRDLHEALTHGSLALELMSCVR